MVRKVLVGSVASLLLLSAPTMGAAFQSPEPVSPGSPIAVGTTAESCPTFSWSSVPRASGYRLVIYQVSAEGGLGGAVVRHSVSAGVSSWTPSLEQGLAPGGSYAWMIGAVTPKGETLWSEPALFQVAATPSPQEIERALAVLEAAYRDRRPQEEDEASPSESPVGEAALEPAGASLVPFPDLLPRPMVRFEGGVDVKPDRGGTLVLGSLSSFNLAFDNNEIMARRAGQPSTLHLNWEGGAIKTGGPLLTHDDVDFMGHDLWNVGTFDLGHTLVVESRCENLTNYSVALCPYPYKIIGGGCASLYNNELQEFGGPITGSYPRLAPQGWVCHVEHLRSCDWVNAFAICADLR
ncbi:MAG: hypothetical protein GY769_03025 [bacterium]|nr:hypothetical protein [bacterium]